MTIYQEIKEYLEMNRWARERKNKDEAVVKMLNVKYPELTNNTQRINFARDFTSYDRLWRLVLMENENLQGYDYNTKQIVEERKEIELGYEPNYHQNKKLFI